MLNPFFYTIMGNNFRKQIVAQRAKYSSRLKSYYTRTGASAATNVNDSVFTSSLNKKFNNKNSNMKGGSSKSVANLSTAAGRIRSNLLSTSSSNLNNNNNNQAICKHRESMDKNSIDLEDEYCNNNCRPLILTTATGDASCSVVKQTTHQQYLLN